MDIQLHDVLFLSFGGIISSLLPIINEGLNRIFKSKHYEIASKVYAVLDPMLQEKLGAKAEGLNTVLNLVKQANDGIDESEARSVAKFVIDRFKLKKALD